MYRPNGRSRELFALFLVTILVPTLRADLLAPGARWIDHDQYIDNLADFPDDALFTYADPLGESAPVTSGEPISLLNGNPINTVHVVSIPRSKLAELGGKPDPKWFTPRDGSLRAEPPFDLPEGVASTTVGLSHVRALDRSDPTDRLVTHLKLERKGKILELTTTSEERHSGVGTRADAAAPPPVPGKSTPVAGSRSPASPLIWVGIPGLALAAILMRVARRRGTLRRPTNP